METQVRVPDIGDFKNVPIIEINVKINENVGKEQSLLTLESDKATMDVPSPMAGKVKEIKAELGDTVSEGSLIFVLESDAGNSPPAPTLAASEQPQELKRALSAPSVISEAAKPPLRDTRPHSSPTPVSRINSSLRDASYASPSVRKLARQLGVDLVDVDGSGSKKRISVAHVIAFVKGVMTRRGHMSAAVAPPPAGVGGLSLLPWPKVDFSKFGPLDTKPLSRIKKISGANLHRNWVMIPHVTNNDEADITELEALRLSLNKENENSGVKSTLLAFVVKAVVAALKEFPTFNSSLDGDNLVFKNYYNIGFAADTPNGLMVPVIRDADKKGLIDIARDMASLSKAAREGKLKAEQMQGGCFSISSLGGIGGTHFTPIINAPEVAILGLSRGVIRPVWNGKEYLPRLVLPLSLSFDHRAVDGAEAGRFNAFLCKTLGDFRRVAL